MIGHWAHRGGESQASVVIREAQINTNMRHYYLTPCRMAIKREEGERERREVGGSGGLNGNVPHGLIYLNICFLVGGTAWKD